MSGKARPSAKAKRGKGRRGQACARRDMLVAKPYGYAGRRDVEVVITQPEFTSLCPMTGLPDFGTLTITYCPDKAIVELKSLKLYLLQYRQMGAFYEHVVNLVLDDLVETIGPKWMEVRGDFTPRGGMTTSASAFFEKED